MENVKEALEGIREWNPEWKPKYFMCYFSEVEIQAIDIIRELRHKLSRDLNWVNKARSARLAQPLTFSFNETSEILCSLFALIMVHCCCVYDCKNNSTSSDLSFHGFPDDKFFLFSAHRLASLSFS